MDSLIRLLRRHPLANLSQDGLLTIGGLRALPWEIQNLLLSAAKTFCETSSGGSSPVPQEKLNQALWTQFLCRFHGLGCRRDPDGAHAALSAISPQTVVQACLSAAIEEEIRDDCEAAEPDQAHNVGEDGPPSEHGARSSARKQPETPWWRQQHLLATDPLAHGISWTSQETSALGARYVSLDDGEEPDPRQMPADPASRNTILHAASFYGILPLVQDLVAIEGLDIDQANNDLDTPLHLAMQAGHPDVVLLLLKKSANSKLENARGETPLHWLGSIEESRLDEVCSSIVASSRLAHLFDRDSISSRIGLISPELSSLDEEPLFKVAEVSRAVLNPSLGPLSSLLACSASVLVMLDPVIAHTLCLRLVCEPMKLAAELYLYKAFDLLCRTCLTVWHCLLEREGASNLPGPLRAAFERSRESPRVVGDLIVTWMDANPFLHGAIVTQIDMLRILCHGRERDDAAASTFRVLRAFGFTNSEVVGPWVGGNLNTIRLATSYGNTAALSTLLAFPEFSEGINKADQTGLTPIDAALEDRQFAALALLAARGAHLDLRRVRDPNHRLTPTEPSYLHLLASLRVEDTAFVNLILDYGVPVSVRDKNGLDPLHLALARSSFAMARVLLANGASLSNGEPFDLTPLGRVFYPMFAEQFDDLRSTLKFILDYERSQGLDLFIVQKGTNLNVLHSMASYCPDDPSYPELVDMVLKHYHEPRRINAPASTASKTTPLETAIVRNNHIAVRRLLEAGANPTQPDFRGTAPIDLALEQVLKLSQAGGEPSKRDALNRALIVVEVIAEKTSWPACLNPLRHALETATPLLEMLRKSQHNVASARKLETSVLDAVFTAIPRNQQGVEYTYLARHLVNRWAKGSIYLHITSRALCSTEDVDLKKSYDKVRQATPWLTGLANARLQELQLSAAFEFMLDLSLRNWDGKGKTYLDRYLPFALSRDPKDLPEEHAIMRYPPTLTEMYRRLSRSREVVPTQPMKSAVREYVRVLADRDERLRRKELPLPPFPESFRKFHFDLLQPRKMEEESLVVAAVTTVNCRCFTETIGTISPTDFARLTRRVSSIDDRTWASRLDQDTELSLELDKSINDWESEPGLGGRFLSRMARYITSNQSGEHDQLLRHPTETGDSDEGSRGRVTGLTRWPSLGVDYKPLVYERREVRLLQLHPSASPDNSDEVVCSMAHYSLDALTNGYRAYAASKEGESPESTHWGWFSAVRAGSDPESRPPRFEWGDFSALSYSWGSPDDIKTITLNGRPSPVGANLEAALRALRNEPHFAAGLRLWVDALCINQTDLAEKSQVLPIMQMLYREASTVTVWLGAPNDTSDDDLEALSKFAGIPHESILQHASLAMGRSVQSLAPLAYSQTILPALVNIIDRPYWTRMWVMQELTRSSPEKQLFIGSKSIWWDELREVMVHYISHVLGDPAYDVDSFDEVTLNRAMHATQHVTLLVVSDSMWRLFPQRADVVTDLGYWKNFLHNAALAGVGDERDRVYGLLSLMPPQMAAHIQPDYTRSVGEVYTDLSAAAIKGLRERAYGIVFVGHRSQPPPGTPSWACALEPHQPVPHSGTLNQAGGREGIFDILAGHAQGARSEEGGADANRPNEGGDGVRREVELESGDVESNSVKPFPLETVDEMYSFVARARFLDEDRNCFFHTVIPFDTVDGIGGPIDLGSGWYLDLPVKYPSRELHVYDNPVQSLARILAGDISTGHRRAQRGSLVESSEAAPDNEREDDHSSMEALLSIPWFESYAPSAIEEQEFVDAGWGDLLSTSHFAIFHRFRLQHRDFPLWKDRPFQAFFPPDASVLRNAEMHTPGKINEVASALRAVKWVVERTFISTKERGLLGSTSRGVRQGDQLVAIVGCPFVVAIREVESDKAQELREKLALDASVRICKVIGECYVEGVMNAELLRDGYLAEHLEEVMFL